MAKHKKYDLPEIAKKFQRVYEYELPEGVTIVKGDIIKIKGKNSAGVGEWGETFKFDSFVTNTDTGVTWIECFEMYRGRAGVQRAFYPERIKRIPVRRKRVSRTRSNQPS
jgi:hypothetical protein